MLHSYNFTHDSTRIIKTYTQVLWCSSLFQLCVKAGEKVIQSRFIIVNLIFGKSIHSWKINFRNNEFNHKSTKIILCMMAISCVDRLMEMFAKRLYTRFCRTRFCYRELLSCAILSSALLLLRVFVGSPFTTYTVMRFADLASQSQSDSNPDSLIVKTQAA